MGREDAGGAQIARAPRIEDNQYGVASSVSPLGAELEETTTG